MTSIVNFEEHMKSTERLSDVFFESTNRFFDAKQTGVLKSDELSKIIVLEGRFFSNLVKRGQRTEEDVESYESHIPNGSYNPFAFNHSDLSTAFERTKQDNTMALFAVETRERQAQPRRR